jgi:SAM-dependent methyltransferase
MADVSSESSAYHTAHPALSVRTIAAMKAVARQMLNKDTQILLRRLYYAGTRYHCNVCENRVRTRFTAGNPFPVLTELDVVGGESITNDTCPVCFSNSRTRLLFEYLKREQGLTRSGSRIKVMHVAPEYGIFARVRADKMVNYVCVDLDPAGYDVSMDITRCDITSIGYPDDSFDLIICSHVLEHVPNDGLAMRQLCRVLKPGGAAVLQVPISASLPHTIEDPSVTDPRERERRFGQNDHVRIYGADYTDRLRDSGFRVEIFDPSTAWGAGVVDELRLNPRERIFVGRK